MEDNFKNELSTTICHLQDPRNHWLPELKYNILLFLVTLLL